VYKLHNSRASMLHGEPSNYCTCVSPYFVHTQNYQCKKVATYVGYIILTYAMHTVMKTRSVAHVESSTKT